MATSALQAKKIATTHSDFVHGKSMQTNKHDAFTWDLVPHCSPHVSFSPCAHFTDVQYDYYSKRLATCSSDQTVRVWDLDDKVHYSYLCALLMHSCSMIRIHSRC
jgi:WD40 repeat protein